MHLRPLVPPSRLLIALAVLAVAVVALLAPADMTTAWSGHRGRTGGRQAAAAAPASGVPTDRCP